QYSHEKLAESRCFCNLFATAYRVLEGLGIGYERCNKNGAHLTGWEDQKDGGWVYTEPEIDRQMKTLTIFFAVITLFLASSRAVAQSDNNVTFKAGVHLVMVPVVVRDSKGQAVGNLTKEDFQLFD